MTELHEILARLDALDARLARIEDRLDAHDRAAHLAADLDDARRRLDALGKQGLRVTELLDDARREIRRLHQERGA